MTAHLPTDASGEQFALTAGTSRAVITEVGATIRTLVLEDIAVIDGFEADEVCPGGAGQVLAPWPNRLEDGSYEFDGTRATCPIDKPSRNTAIHGLVRWLSWVPLDLQPSTVTLACTLAPQPGYPWRLHSELDYTLAPGVLTVTARVRNASASPAPFGIGFHPYLLAGAGGVDEAHLAVPATRRLRVDARGLPVEVAPVGDPPVAGRLGAAVLDDCFTGLLRDADGYWRVHFQPTPDEDLVVFADERFGYVMCFTGDTLAPPRRRRAVAIEPMTCPPNALRSGTDLIELAPGETVSAVWGIALG